MDDNIRIHIFKLLQYMNKALVLSVTEI